MEILHALFTGDNPYSWMMFFILLFIMLFFDLFVLNKSKHTIGIREALITSALWISIALLFNLGIYIFGDHVKATEFLTGYLIEKSLSVDNLFVFTLIFAYFKVDPKHQPTILIWGIFGAIIFRAVFILAGVVLVKQFGWILYIFGVLLVLTGFKMLFAKDDDDIHPENKMAIKFTKKLFPITNDFEKTVFFVRRNGKLFATTLFLVLIAIETTDVMFAIDSIPAIFGITNDPYIIFTSNIFAILGLRALYFVLASVIEMFKYLKYAVILILIFIGVKMLLVEFIHIPTAYSLGFIGLSLTVATILSFILQKKKIAK